ncbi:MAG: CbiX/SirB N-terminal domain-containing protein [Dechloromonas sp.]|nr:CbiX/SirB N-terminal domain-containing protein [Dechloromonas sp.]
MTTALLLFAHGARDPEWAQPLQRVKAAIQAQRPGQLVELAFLEFMAPDLPAAASQLVAAGAQRIQVLPMFIAQGGHLKRDLPQLIDRLRSTWPQVEFMLAPAVGEDARVSTAMAAVALDFVG